MVVAGPNGSGKSTLLNAIRANAGYTNIIKLCGSLTVFRVFSDHAKSKSLHNRQLVGSLATRFETERSEVFAGNDTVHGARIDEKQRLPELVWGLAGFRTAAVT